MPGGNAINTRFSVMEKTKGMAGGPASFDPSTLNDPVASRTDWTPAKRGGASFRTHILVAVNPYRMELRPSLGAKLFYLVFPVLGLGVLLGFSFPKLISEGFSTDLDTVMPLLLGLIFVSAGATMLFFGTRPIVFDKSNGFFWKGRKAPDRESGDAALKRCAELKQIHALQLISEYCRGNKNSYYSFELNLVLENGKRINVVDHGNRNKLCDDAASLSRFLEKPVWDVMQL